MAASPTYTYTFKVEPQVFRRALYFNTFGKQRIQSVIIAAMALTSQNALGVDLGGFEFSFWLQCAVPVLAFVLGMFVLPAKGKR